jgi:hypothetical protein
MPMKNYEGATLTFQGRCLRAGLHLEDLGMRVFVGCGLVGLALLIAWCRTSENGRASEQLPISRLQGTDFPLRLPTLVIDAPPQEPLEPAVLPPISIELREAQATTGDGSQYAILPCLRITSASPTGHSVHAPAWPPARVRGPAEETLVLPEIGLGQSGRLPFQVALLADDETGLPGGIELMSAEALAAEVDGVLPAGIELISAEAMSLQDDNTMPGGIELISAESLRPARLPVTLAGVVSVFRLTP